MEDYALCIYSGSEDYESGKIYKFYVDQGALYYKIVLCTSDYRTIDILSEEEFNKNFRLFTLSKFDIERYR